MYETKSLKRNLGFLLLCISFLVFFSEKIYGQEYEYEFGGTVGTSFYMGDANKSKMFKNSNLAAGLILRYNRNFRWAYKANLLIGGISGDTRKSGNVFPNGEQASFSRTFYELGGQVEFNFFNYSDKYQYLGTKRLSPYVFTGLGVTYGSGDESFFGLNLPLGIGLKYKLKDRLNLGFEFSFRKLFGDSFDVTSKDKNGLTLDDPYGIKSNFFKNKDWYVLTMFSVTWDFGLRKNLVSTVYINLAKRLKLKTTLMSSLDKINKDNLPKHIAIIMDGNGRWANKRNLDRTYGHREGITSVRNIIEAASKINIRYVTLYTFSTENWNRPIEEIDALMSLMVQAIARETPDLIKNNIRLKTIGNISRLPKETLDALEKCIEDTSSSNGTTLILALSYSSKWEITEAVKKIALEFKHDKIDEIDESLIDINLTTAGIPDPDLLIRTGGEQRISNFLLWQLAYSELYFTNTLWPDFREDNFYEAIVDYQNRERRFGKTSAQIKG